MTVLSVKTDDFENRKKKNEKHNNLCIFLKFSLRKKKHY